MTNFLSRLLLFIALAVTATAAKAALAMPGQWSAVPVYSYPLIDIIETPQLVYYAAGGGLFSYDKDTQESRSYTVTGQLNANDVSYIKYNEDGGYLFIGYSSGHIDLMYDDGNIVSIPYIADAVTVDSHTINNVVFDHDNHLIYVATGFGLVKIDDRKHEVIESGIYGKDVLSVALSDTHVVIGCENHLLTLPKGKSIKSFDSFFSLVWASIPLDIVVLDNKAIVSRSGWADEMNMLLCEVDFANNRIKDRKFLNPNATTLANKMIEGSDGLYFTSAGRVYVMDYGDYSVSEVLKLPEEFISDIITFRDNVSSVWSMNYEGIINISLDKNGSGYTILSDRAFPDALSVRRVCFFIPSADGKKLYITSDSSSPSHFDGVIPELRYLPQATSVLDLQDFGGMAKTEIYPVEVGNKDLAGYQDKHGKYALGTRRLAEDPDEPGTYFISTGRDGIYKARGREFAGRFTHENSPILNAWGPVTYATFIDCGGNLWVFGESDTNYTGISVLPASKRTTDPSDIRISDWTKINIPGYSSGQSISFLNSKRSGMIFIADHRAEPMLLAYDTRGTYDNFADDKYYMWNSFTDQDGKTVNPGLVLSLAEDADGKVWIGTTGGVFVINNPAKATDPSMTVTHVKVPRNDGTNSADYLLSSDRVQCMSVDPANRKWLATSESGLYLVSPDGSSILKHFNKDNSPLPSNNVFSVYANPFNSDVYVGTGAGMYVYGSDTSAPAEDYSDIYAYPNPVRPDYSGPIYVKGLMDGSLVKITDASGSVLAQGKAEGGMFIWDGCNMSGARVRTGVYYIFASQSSDGSSSGAVAKVMVVN